MQRTAGTGWCSPALVVIGISALTLTHASNSLMQLETASAMRGRVMASSTSCGTEQWHAASSAGNAQRANASRDRAADAIEVVYLPSYSPQFNPDEMATAHIKQAIARSAPVHTKLQLVKATARHLRSVQRQPERIRKYFEHEPVRYAASLLMPEQ
jgi:transposase